LKAGFGGGKNVAKRSVGVVGKGNRGGEGKKAQGEPNEPYERKGTTGRQSNHRKFLEARPAAQ
jgi:hypothetical protein